MLRCYIVLEVFMVFVFSCCFFGICFFYCLNVCVRFKFFVYNNFFCVEYLGFFCFFLVRILSNILILFFYLVYVIIRYVVFFYFSFLFKLVFFDQNISFIGVESYIGIVVQYWVFSCLQDLVQFSKKKINEWIN